MKRRYPERLVPSTIWISVEYMKREAERWGRDVEGWVLEYLGRNGIPSFLEEGRSGKRLRVNFQSVWRQKFFVLKANAEFPYFEFV
jgi:hypothetical protein